MKLKNLKLVTANVCPNRNGEFEVVETSVNRNRLESGAFGRDVESYNIMCAAFRGDVVKVKVPKTFALEITEMHDALNQNKGVFVTFTGLTLRAYAMASDNPQNGVISGVVGNASDFTYRIEEEDDDVDINIEL